MAAPRRPKPVTAEALEAAALFYLERFASSSANLRRVLMRRVRRSAELHGAEAEAGQHLVDALIQRFLGAGLLDDGRYAGMKAASLHRRGASARTIFAKLAGQGVERDLIAAALRETDDSGRPGGDLAAAIALARRRRLGPFRAAPDRTAHRLKDLAALARAGFGQTVAKRVIDAVDPAALDDLCNSPETEPT